MRQTIRGASSTRIVGAAVVALAQSLSAGPASAQIPEEFKNLQVLPKDIDQRQLVGRMRHFAGSLGVRCNHCHVGPDNLEGMDFATDEKLTKRKARHMLKMVESLNRDHFASLPGDGPKPEARCNTCHHGVVKPVMLEVVLAEAVEEGGIDEGLARYRELRDQYYGRGAYDFGDRSLVRLARQLGETGRHDQAIPFLELNVELFPESYSAHFALGEGLMAAGDRGAAASSYRRALELKPDPRQVAFIKNRLSDAEAGDTQP